MELNQLNNNDSQMPNKIEFNIGIGEYIVQTNITKGENIATNKTTYTTLGVRSINLSDLDSYDNVFFRIVKISDNALDSESVREGFYNFKVSCVPTENYSSYDNMNLTCGMILVENEDNLSFEVTNENSEVSINSPIMLGVKINGNSLEGLPDIRYPLDIKKPLQEGSNTTIIQISGITKNILLEFDFVKISIADFLSDIFEQNPWINTPISIPFDKYRTVTNDTFVEFFRSIRFNDYPLAIGLNINDLKTSITGLPNNLTITENHVKIYYQNRFGNNLTISDFQNITSFCAFLDYQICMKQIHNLILFY